MQQNIIEYIMWLGIHLHVRSFQKRTPTLFLDDFGIPSGAKTGDRDKKKALSKCKVKYLSVDGCFRFSSVNFGSVHVGSR